MLAKEDALHRAPSQTSRKLIHGVNTGFTENYRLHENDDFRQDRSFS
jgi:hypothetical protein